MTITYKQMIASLNKDMERYDNFQVRYQNLVDKYEKAWDAACSARNYLVTLDGIING